MKKVSLLFLLLLMVIVTACESSSPPKTAEQMSGIKDTYGYELTEKQFKDLQDYSSRYDGSPMTREEAIKLALQPGANLEEALLPRIEAWKKTIKEGSYATSPLKDASYENAPPMPLFKEKSTEKQ